MVEAALLEPAPQHLPVDVVDGRDTGQDEVEDEEVSLEAVGDVVLAASRVAHGRNVLQVLAHLLFGWEKLKERGRGSGAGPRSARLRNAEDTELLRRYRAKL